MFFTKILFPLADLSNAWNYQELICLPNIDSTDDLKDNGFTQQEIQVKSQCEIPS